MGMLLLVLYRSNFRLQNLFSIGIVPRPYIGSRGSKSLIIDPSVWLEREVTLEEVNDAMWRCEGFKAPGPDDFNFNFSIYIYI
jgi:hypothetical protein